MEGLSGRSELEREAALRTPTQVRNLVVLWYYNAFKDNLLAAKRRLGVPATEERVYDSAVALVRLAFKEAGADFNNPTRDSLRSVVRLLSKRTRNWPKESGDKPVHRELLKLVRHLK